MKEGEYILITEFDLDKAIAECQGVPNPNAKTCMLLASFLTIKKEMFGKDEQERQPVQYSFDNAPDDDIIVDTDFKQMLSEKPINDVFDIIEDLMNTLELLSPKLHNSIMERLEELDSK